MDTQKTTPRHAGCPRINEKVPGRCPHTAEATQSDSGGTQRVLSMLPSYCISDLIDSLLDDRDHWRNRFMAASDRMAALECEIRRLKNHLDTDMETSLQ